MSSNSPSPQRLAPGIQEYSLLVGGRTRNYLVHAPPDIDHSRPIPVVLVFHGGGTNANWVRRFCGLTCKSAECGFLAVFPSGTGLRERRLSWNCGPRSGFERWVGGEGADLPLHQVDEKPFVQAILDDLDHRCTLDRRRVFASGVSTGAIMAYYLAAQMADQIAAIAPVGGPMGDVVCQPSRPVSIIHFHGTEDRFAPYEGGKGSHSFTGADFISVEESIQAWVKANRCNPAPEVVEIPQVTHNGTHVTRSRYFGGAEDSEVVLYTIWGGGHTWPGQDPRVDLMGRFTRDIIANDLIWDFFQKHPIPVASEPG